MDGLPHFKWRNCHGDVICNRFDAVITAYWDKVALPALHHAEAEVAFWANNNEGGAVFAYAEVVDQQLVTASAMCLSLQSIWERQLRAYLLSCAGWTDAKLTNQLQHAPWDALQDLFEQLRGVPLRAFLSYPDLDLLARLGNACRHGAGRAANALWRSHPKRWPHSAWPADSAVAPPVEHMQLSKALLARFVSAIAGFWQVLGYLYNESIDMKHSSLEVTLREQRLRHAAAVAHLNRVVGSAGSNVPQ
jgi:hypothetical protein